MRKNRPNTNPAIAAYLKDISKYPLLTPVQEHELGMAIKNGTPEECAKARKILAESNLRLVTSVAKTYNGTSLELLDLIQLGNEGLMHAVDKFEPEKGCRFSTYATYWIKNAIIRNIYNTDHTIRIPIYLREKINKVNNAEKELSLRYDRKPTPEEIAVELQWEVTEVWEVLDVKKFSDEVTSLSTPIGNSDKKGESTLEDFLENQFNERPEEAAMKQMMTEEVATILQKALTPKEYDVITLRFGLNGVANHTLQKVADKYDISRERVRQIESGALKKLADGRYSHLLRSLL